MAILLYAVPILFVAAFAGVLRAVMTLFDGVISAKIGSERVAKVEFLVYLFLTYGAFVLLATYGIWIGTGGL